LRTIYGLHGEISKKVIPICALELNLHKLSKMSAAPLRVAIAGLGTVGAGVAKILNANGALIAQRCNRAIELVGVSDPNVSAIDGVPSDKLGQAFDDCLGMLDGCSPDVIVETIGGTGVALQLNQKAAGMGISIVTANKALLAKHGEELTQVSHTLLLSPPSPPSLSSPLSFSPPLSVCPQR
jgi:hypothetical protein